MRSLSCIFQVAPREPDPKPIIHTSSVRANHRRTEAALEPREDGRHLSTVGTQLGCSTCGRSSTPVWVCRRCRKIARLAARSAKETIAGRPDFVSAERSARRRSLTLDNESELAGRAMELWAIESGVRLRFYPARASRRKQFYRKLQWLGFAMP